MIVGRAGHVVNSENWNLQLCSSNIIDTNIYRRGGGVIFCLYIYPEESISNKLFDPTTVSDWEPDSNNLNRIPNFKLKSIKKFSTKLNLSFNPHLAGRKHSIQGSFGPDDVLAYIYAIIHSPTYRERYAEFLKIDFPRVPFTANVDLFCALVGLGRELIDLHLMKSPSLKDTVTSFPVPGDNQVAPRGGYPKYATSEQDSVGRVYINREQYINGVANEVWEFQIGGYQVLHKWLKDRRGRMLSFDDLRHYQQVVVALSETLRLMEEIDAAIPGWPIN